MPTIKRKPINEKPVKYKRESKEHASEFYNSIAWKRLRNTFLSQHPLCEECLKREIIKEAEHIHHRYFWDSFNTEELKWQKFLDERNLMSLCSNCHYAMHNKARRYGISFCDSLTDKEYNESHSIE